jgi:flagellar basal-body rod modification protein FlgD
MVSPVSNSSTTTADTSNSMKQLSGNFSTFLTLLTTQLKNQDPTSPMDSNAFTQQLVMYSQVEQQIDTNTNLKTLIGQNTTNAGAMAAAYLGKKVSVTNGNASLSGGSAAWVYNLDTASAATQLAITDANGKTVFSGLGENTAGSHAFTWDGKDANGNQLPDGTYKLAVTATDSGNNKVTSSVASAGVVGQIDMTGGTPKLIVGSMEVDFADIAALAN